MVSLHEAPDLTPLVVRWYVEHWAPYYGPAGPGDAEADLRATLGIRGSGSGLPVCLVALDAEGQAVGSVSLRAASISHPELSPWVTGAVVPASHRGAGIGERLLIAAEQAAAEQAAAAAEAGIDTLYVAVGGPEADQPADLLERRGWRRFDAADSLRGRVDVYALPIAPGAVQSGSR